MRLVGSLGGGRRRDRLPALWVAVASLLSGWMPISDGDIFWHLAAGREMVRRGALLTDDPFSISAAGRAWIDVHWLFQLAVYGLHQAFGLAGLVIVKCVLIGASALVLLFSLPRSARGAYALIVTAALVCARPLLVVRPVIISLLCLALFLAQLERFRVRGVPRLLWPLLPVQLLWCNVQGLFALGPSVIAAYALAAAAQARWGTHPRYPFYAEQPALTSAAARARARWLFAALGGSLCLTLLSPFGARAFGLPWRLLSRLIPHAGNPYQNVAENVPPFALDRAGAAEFWHLSWFLWLLAAVLALRARRVPFSHLLVLAGFTGLALLGNRNVLLLYFAAAPLLALHVTPSVRRVRLWLVRGRLVPRRGVGAIRHAANVATVGLLCLLLGLAARETAIAQPTPFHFPVRSARAIAEHGGEGELFCADHQGGYFIWQLYPTFKPYVDTRWILRSPQEFREYLSLADDPERWDGFARGHDFAYVALPVAYPDRYLGLIARLYASERWKLVQTDGAEVLFARADLVQGGAWDLFDGATTEHVLAQLRTRYASSPRLHAAARLQLASLQLAVGAYAEARHSLDGSAEPDALSLRARAHLLAGELVPAETLAERMLRELPDDVRSLDLMAQVWVRRGQPARALALLRRAVELDPFDDEAASLIANLEVPRHDP